MHSPAEHSALISIDASRHPCRNEYLRDLSFNYSTLPEEVAAKLQLQAARIKERISKTTQDLIDIGRDLEASRQHLDHGQFITWVETEVGISRRSAQRYMTVARLADDKGDTVSLLSLRSIQRLAAKSTPPEIVDQVLDRVRSGDRLLERDVSEMISDAKSQQREAERRAEKEARRRKLSKKRRKAEEVRERAWQDAERKRKQRIDKIAEDLINALGVAGATLVVKSFSDDMWDVLAALRKKVGLAEQAFSETQLVLAVA